MKKRTVYSLFLLTCLFVFLCAGLSYSANSSAGSPKTFQHFVDIGRLSPEIIEQLGRAGEAEVLLILDGSDAKALAKQMRETFGVKNDNAGIISEKARLYNEKKNLVMSRILYRDIALLMDYDNLPVMYVRVNENALLQLLNMTEVESVGDNRRVVPHLAESLPLINAPQTHSAGATGAGTSVAVLDTGVNYTLSAFGNCTAPGTPSTCKVAYVQDFAPSDGSLDDDGHGTNVSGIVVGVAPDTKILGLDVFRTDGYAYYSDILSALDWVLTNKDLYNIAAVNMSFGGGRYTAQCPSDGLASAITDLKNAGITSAVASGNNGYLDSTTAPACATDAVSVGAVYDSNLGGINWSSCSDATTAADKVTCFSNSASFLTMLAPGALITSAGITMGGTSQAAPHVAGSVAVIKGQNGTLTVNEVVTRLTDKGVPVTDWRNAIIKPRLDLYASVFPDPLIAFSPSSLFFNEIGGGALPPAQSLSISNAGSGTMSWSVGDDSAWLDLSPLSGTNSGAVSVSVTSSALAAGSYSATITISAPTASNSPQTVPVTLTVFDPVLSDQFETGDLSTLPWKSGGNGSWGVEGTTKYSGSYAVQSPAMGDSLTSYLEVTLNICAQGYVYFWLKTSTEPQWDNLKFRIDGINEGPWNGWSGETPWTQVSSEHAVTPGLHTFRWEYSKDAGISSGSDAVWLDDIVFPSFNLPVKLLSQYYTSILGAYSAAVDGDIILMQEYPFAETLVLDRNVSVTLKGGYDCNYTSNPGFVTISGPLTVSGGTVAVENLVLK